MKCSIQLTFWTRKHFSFGFRGVWGVDIHKTKQPFFFVCVIWSNRQSEAFIHNCFFFFAQQNILQKDILLVSEIHLLPLTLLVHCNQSEI